MITGSCTAFKEDLSCLIDEHLENERRQAVSHHLTECAGCRREYESLKSLKGLLAAGMCAESVAPVDIWEGLAVRLPGVCEVVQDDFSAYLDGELAPPAAEGVRQHIKECSPCREKFSQINATNQLLSQGLALPAGLNVDLWAAVKSRLNEDCALIQNELSAYIDQEVATLRHRSITAHLLDCPNCRGLFNQLSEVGDLVRSSYQPAFPDNFNLWPEIKAKIQVLPFAPKAKPKSRIFTNRLYLVGAAAVILGIAGSLTFFVNARPDT
ncbi:MAG TPA: zf-HC2 domain-containing protein, partial [Candidatus Obscuribacterales bacterium]